MLLFRSVKCYLSFSSYFSSEAIYTTLIAEPVPVEQPGVNCLAHGRNVDSAGSEHAVFVLPAQLPKGIFHPKIIILALLTQPHIFLIYTTFYYET